MRSQEGAVGLGPPHSGLGGRHRAPGASVGKLTCHPGLPHKLGTGLRLPELCAVPCGGAGACTGRSQPGRREPAGPWGKRDHGDHLYLCRRGGVHQEGAGLRASQKQQLWVLRYPDAAGRRGTPRRPPPPVSVLRPGQPGSRAALRPSSRHAGDPCPWPAAWLVLRVRLLIGVAGGVGSVLKYVPGSL